MPEPGDKLDRAYRELAREEPGAALDDAILAASRRAVGSRPGAAPRRGFAARWGAPISIAAVLVLGITVALRMQVEQPGIETSMPRREAPAVIPKAIEAPPPQAVPEPPGEAPKPALRAAKPAAPAQPEAARERKEARKAEVPAPQSQGFAPEPPAILSAPVPAAPPVMQAAPATAAPAPATTASERFTRPQAMQAPVAKRAAGAGAAADTAISAESNLAPRSPEAELERIAKLRAEGRDEEADKALEAFRKKHPDYRIAEAMWERVRRR